MVSRANSSRGHFCSLCSCDLRNGEFATEREWSNTLAGGAAKAIAAAAYAGLFALNLVAAIPSMMENAAKEMSTPIICRYTSFWRATLRTAAALPPLVPAPLLPLFALSSFLTSCRLDAMNSASW